MKAITVRLDDGGLDPLLKRVRLGQELGFEQFDLCICNPQAALGRIAARLKENGVALTALRLKEPRHTALVPRRPGYAKLGAVDRDIAQRSCEMVIETAERLSGTPAQYLVLDGGFAHVQNLNDKQLQIDELLDCDEISPERVTEIVALDPGVIEQQLERLCRGLHQIAKQLVPLQVCLLPPDSPFGLLQPERMEQVLAELNAQNIAYWHSTSAVAISHKLGGDTQNAWIERFSSKLKGVYLEDMLGGHGEQPPGIGEINFEDIAPELAQTTVRVMVVDDDKGTKLRFGSEYLSKVGIF